MDEHELVDLYDQLRSVAIRSGLAWLLEELDEAIAVGVVEIKPLKQQTRMGRTTYEELTVAERTGPGRRRAEEFLSRRPLTLLEQVDALIDALARALVDLHAIAAAAVVQLNDLPVAAPADEEPSVSSRRPHLQQQIGQGIERTLVSEIDFQPDEGSLVAPITTEELRHNTDRSEDIARILNEIRSAAHE